MSNQNQKTDVKSRKALISKKCDSFISRMSASKNDLERVELLNEMDDLLQDEIDHWLNEVMLFSEMENPAADSVIDEASLHVSGLKMIQDKIALQRLPLLPNALRLQEVLIAQGKLDKPKIVNIQS